MSLSIRSTTRAMKNHCLGRIIVEYALYDARKPIGVATYKTTRTLPLELKGQLPPPEDIAALLEGIEE